MQKLEQYVAFLQDNRPELDALYHDILIHVTGFFRDPENFEALKKDIFPQLIAGRPAHAPIRLWVPGCSTGEEAYSLAIILLEFLGDKAASAEIQLFATDINESALEKARLALYAEHDVESVSAGRLRRFFVKLPNGYQINKSIRDMCVFARQDITKDPPFSRLDLISCRNLLIYLDTSLQKKVLPMLHYALKPNGYLFLGTSESISLFAEHFEMVDKRHKIYVKKPTSPRLPIDFPRREDWTGAVPGVNRIAEPVAPFDIQKEADRVLLARYAPAGVVVNAEMEILSFRGRTGRYLEPAPGQASLSLPKMARQGLAADIRTAVQRAKKDQAAIKRPGIPFRSNGGYQEVNLEVVPVKGPGAQEQYFLVLFSEPPKLPGNKGKQAQPKTKVRQQDVRELAHLKDELAPTKSALQSIIEEQETTNEELKSANEEVLSANEELQSTNEELETAKEELQSTNEELTTLNEELQNRNTELSNANNDLLNLLGSVSLPILMLGNDLRIRRATPAAEKLLNLIGTDIGRPISDIKSDLQLERFDQLVLESIDTVTVKELEVQDRGGQWYFMRIRPYKTADNRIDGALVMWLNMQELKMEPPVASQHLRELVEIAHEPMVILDQSLRVKAANNAFHRSFNLKPGQAAGRPIYELADHQWDSPELRTALEVTLPKEGTVRRLEVTHELPANGKRQLVFNARRLETPDGTLIVLAIQDVSAPAGPSGGAFGQVM
jgi:two-component system CheB/CheR fusion protein